jgi:hypothetical protein
MSRNMNDDRAEWAQKTIDRFMYVTGMGIADKDDALSDLLCDLMHWCDKYTGQDFDRELERARSHYKVEVVEDEEVDV